MWPPVIGSEIEFCTLAYRNEDGKIADIFGPSWKECLELQKGFILECVPDALQAPHLDYTGANGMLTTFFFLSNAARFLFDTGGHVEYAASEGLGPRPALVHQKAGDRIVEYAIARANELWRANPGVHLRSFKNNIAINGQSYGAHESYLTLRNERTSPDSMKSTLVPFLISRIIFTGNGWLRRSGGNKLEYLLSQRASVITNVLSGATTNNRAIINTRDEPHCGPDGNEKFRRQHVIIGDSLTLEPALYFMFAATSMVLDMIESGFYPAEEYPGFDEESDIKILKALEDFNRDPALRVTVDFGGKTYSAVELQEWYRDKAHRYFEATGRLDEVRDIFDLWDKLIEGAKSPCPREALKRHVEQAAKLCVMEMNMERFGYDWNTPPLKTVPRSKRLHRRSGRKFADTDIFTHLKDIDFKFHENSPKGIARILERRGEVDRIVTEEEIASAVFEPLPGTRAIARSKQHRWLEDYAAGLREIFKIAEDWERLEVRGVGRFVWSFLNSDPFDENPRLPRLLQ